MKRFYDTVTVTEEEGGFTVALDGRPVRTPARRPLCLPTRPLAEAVAEEWRAQRERIEPRRMPLTRLATTAVDHMPARREDTVRHLLDFARSDTLCYRVSTPRDLAERQARCWQPWLDWAARVLGAELRTTDGLALVPQPPAALARLERVLRDLDDWHLVAVHALACDLHSLVLALAVARGDLAADEAFALAHLEELYEIERWGEVDLQRRRHAELRRAVDAAARFLALLPPGGVSAGPETPAAEPSAAAAPRRRGPSP